uniref:ATP synthase complex subunit 8 n=1 Tax=Menura novaehollandiae TaxID=47692 RepID=Q2KT01_9PASS|nr:ATP synthase F0 subunit 8 [Menura novaehollandiae]USH58142.1 ATP synthase F0 subunit 8 [Menura alberti]AAS17738.1 ATP synthase subunit 8 [Menura novaehollandiae]QOD95631.1 ATP synthase F0 subunit 8 [Menura novaehollandiae]USH58155.1 ATP synthase F0 subunit 8 [Menura novaehollandiae]USH58194.1 ATP synthase F0 subunit 8 [Menura alberti]
MPQLNPNPWLFTMLITWATYSLLIQPKLLSFTSTNPPTNKLYQATDTTPWTWPWT